MAKKYPAKAVDKTWQAQMVGLKLEQRSNAGKVSFFRAVESFQARVTRDKINFSSSNLKTFVLQRLAAEHISQYLDALAETLFSEVDASSLVIDEFHSILVELATRWFRGDGVLPFSRKQLYSHLPLEDSISFETDKFRLLRAKVAYLSTRVLLAANPLLGGVIEDSLASYDWDIPEKVEEYQENEAYYFAKASVVILKHRPTRVMERLSQKLWPLYRLGEIAEYAERSCSSHVALYAKFACCIYENNKLDSEMERLLLQLAVDDSRLKRFYSADPCVVLEEIRQYCVSNKVCGYIVPDPSCSVSAHLRVKSAPIVLTETLELALAEIAAAVHRENPVLLEASPGGGKTSLINELARQMHVHEPLYVHLGDQIDAKFLVGSYTCADEPGTFKWQAGVLAQALETGRWIVFEEFGNASNDVISLLFSILERRALFIPNLNKELKAHPSFRIFATRSLYSEREPPKFLAHYLWSRIFIPAAPSDVPKILEQRYPELGDTVDKIVKLGQSILELVKGQADWSVFAKHASYSVLRNSLKLANRLVSANLPDSEDIFLEALDCFASRFSSLDAVGCVAREICKVLDIPEHRAEFYLGSYCPQLQVLSNTVQIGRASLSCFSDKSQFDPLFAPTRVSMRLLEKMTAAVCRREPVLLVGETGTGKTAAVQYLAKCVGAELVVINMSQQSESSDLLGGFKPVTLVSLAQPLYQDFESLFSQTFPVKKNLEYLDVTLSLLQRAKWNGFVTALTKAVSGAILKLQGDNRKRRRTELMEKWCQFKQDFLEFESQWRKWKSKLLFKFVDGALVEALKLGKWILFDEMNLASQESLETLSGLLDGPESSILLLEKGDSSLVPRHEQFRIFACINDSTDVGKRELPIGFRTRFTEIYSHMPDIYPDDVLLIVEGYLGAVECKPKILASDIVKLYFDFKTAAKGSLVDGSGRSPIITLRTLSRSFQFYILAADAFGVDRALYEGFVLFFVSSLSRECQTVGSAILQRYFSYVVKMPGPKQLANTILVEGFPLDLANESVVPATFVLTNSVKGHLRKIARASLTRRFPVLLEGPTSSGKTSIVQYLANVTGHEFVRINNHEHTDLQEYIGSYVVNAEGKLVFEEGALVKAARTGQWIVLDELNLAPTDVLEAINRLLDDNRELFIAETQTVVKAHPHFMLFATQNPSGIYGGRKELSRAFRNRFVEIFIDDMPEDELSELLHQRCQMAPSHAKKLVDVFKQLHQKRARKRIFEGKDGFITLRDLFKWANRGSHLAEDLARDGFLILAERMRDQKDKLVVLDVLQSVFKVQLEPRQFYESYFASNIQDTALAASMVWTLEMKRLFCLTHLCYKHREPLLLVGETGCGKTTIVEVVAQQVQPNKEFSSISCHQGTEVSDFLGSQRPVRQNSKDSVLPFEWSDGPLVRSMKEGNIFLIDEISLADDAVLERLNSVLEPNSLLVLAEKNSSNSEIEQINGVDGFFIAATMNPGGDFGKKELSPALRNRFTEVWAPPLSSFDDFSLLCTKKLDFLPIDLTTFCGKFFDFLCGRQSALNLKHLCSLRDLTSFFKFCQTCDGKVPTGVAVGEGIKMVFIDGNSRSASATLSDALQVLLEEFIGLEQPSADSLANVDSLEVTQTVWRTTADGFIGVDPFYFKAKELSSVPKDAFAFGAPTTLKNLRKVLCGMQLKKPILLEGDPGAGKTSLIQQIAAVANYSLIRINMSEQTDIADLFGNDAPNDCGTFSWRNGPLLEAMERGDWVLLDELNLASQSALEGLNSCLDYRHSVFIPELNRTFFCHENFRVFASQNPVSMGGNRKGLPQSFLNRFTRISVGSLTVDDFSVILANRYESLSKAVIEKLTTFMRSLNEILVDFTGGPWEVNLRDLIRWIEMCNCVEELLPAYFPVAIARRFRSNQDVERAGALFKQVFEIESDNLIAGGVVNSVGVDRWSFGVADLRLCSLSKRDYLDGQSFRLDTIGQSSESMETLVCCISQNSLAVVTGDLRSGKSSLVRQAASLCGKKLVTMYLNASMDSAELLGGFEQVNIEKKLRKVFEQFESIALKMKRPNKAVQLLRDIHAIKKLENVSQAQQLLLRLESLDDNDAKVQRLLLDLKSKLASLEALVESGTAGGRFEWVDSPLVEALEKGYWVLLENANLCSSAVIDRLNSVFESDGVLVLNEQGIFGGDGRPRTIVPHSGFKCFMTYNPRYGELSRAMRNRSIELHIPSSNSLSYSSGDSCSGPSGTLDASHGDTDSFSVFEGGRVKQVAHSPTISDITVTPDFELFDWVRVPHLCSLVLKFQRFAALPSKTRDAFIPTFLACLSALEVNLIKSGVLNYTSGVLDGHEHSCALKVLEFISGERVEKESSFENYPSMLTGCKKLHVESALGSSYLSNIILAQWLRLESRATQIGLQSAVTCELNTRRLLAANLEDASSGEASQIESIIWLNFVEKFSNLVGNRREQLSALLVFLVLSASDSLSHDLLRAIGTPSSTLVNSVSTFYHSWRLCRSARFLASTPKRLNLWERALNFGQRFMVKRDAMEMLATLSCNSAFSEALVPTFEKLLRAIELPAFQSDRAVSSQPLYGGLSKLYRFKRLVHLQQFFRLYCERDDSFKSRQKAIAALRSSVDAGLLDLKTAPLDLVNAQVLNWNLQGSKVGLEKLDFWYRMLLQDAAQLALEFPCDKLYESTLQSVFSTLQSQRRLASIELFQEVSESLKLYAKEAVLGFGGTPRKIDDNHSLFAGDFFVSSYAKVLQRFNLVELDGPLAFKNGRISTWAEAFENERNASHRSLQASSLTLAMAILESFHNCGSDFDPTILEELLSLSRNYGLNFLKARKLVFESLDVFYRGNSEPRLYSSVLGEQLSRRARGGEVTAVRSLGEFEEQFETALTLVVNSPPNELWRTVSDMAYNILAFVKLEEWNDQRNFWSKNQSTLSKVVSAATSKLLMFENGCFYQGTECTELLRAALLLLSVAVECQPLPKPDTEPPERLTLKTLVDPECLRVASKSEGVDFTELATLSARVQIFSQKLRTLFKPQLASALDLIVKRAAVFNMESHVHQTNSLDYDESSEKALFKRLFGYSLDGEGESNLQMDSALADTSSLVVPLLDFFGSTAEKDCPKFCRTLIWHSTNGVAQGVDPLLLAFSSLIVEVDAAEDVSLSSNYGTAFSGEELYKVSLLFKDIGAYAEAIAKGSEDCQLGAIVDCAASVLRQSPLIKLSEAILLFERCLFAMHEYERIYNDKRTFESRIHSVSKLILECREKEVKSWERLMHDENMRLKNKVQQCWVSLLQFGLSGDASVLLETFLTQSTIGEFEYRIDLVESLVVFLSLNATSSLSEKFCQSSGFLLTRLKLYTSKVKAYIAQERVKIEKELLGFIRLVQWKDVNVYALRETGRKSHRQLLKYVRAYGKVLQIPLTEFIQNIDNPGQGYQRTCTSRSFSFCPSETVFSSEISNVDGDYVDESVRITYGNTLKRLRQLSKDEPVGAESCFADYGAWFESFFDALASTSDFNAKLDRIREAEARKRFGKQLRNMRLRTLNDLTKQASTAFKVSLRAPAQYANLDTYFEGVLDNFKSVTAYGVGEVARAWLVRAHDMTLRLCRLYKTGKQPEGILPFPIYDFQRAVCVGLNLGLKTLNLVSNTGCFAAYYTTVLSAAVAVENVDPNEACYEDCSFARAAVQVIRRGTALRHHIYLAAHMCSELKFKFQAEGEAPIDLSDLDDWLLALGELIYEDNTLSNARCVFNAAKVEHLLNAMAGKLCEKLLTSVQNYFGEFHLAFETLNDIKISLESLRQLAKDALHTSGPLSKPCVKLPRVLLAIQSMAKDNVYQNLKEVGKSCNFVDVSCFDGQLIEKCADFKVSEKWGESYLVGRAALLVLRQHAEAKLWGLQKLVEAHAKGLFFILKGCVLLWQKGFNLPRDAIEVDEPDTNANSGESEVAGGNIADAPDAPDASSTLEKEDVENLNGDQILKSKELDEKDSNEAEQPSGDGAIEIDSGDLLDDAKLEDCNQPTDDNDQEENDYDDTMVDKEKDETLGDDSNKLDEQMWNPADDKNEITKSEEKVKSKVDKDDRHPGDSETFAKEDLDKNEVSNPENSENSGEKQDENAAETEKGEVFDDEHDIDDQHPENYSNKLNENDPEDVDGDNDSDVSFELDDGMNEETGAEVEEYSEKHENEVDQGDSVASDEDMQADDGVIENANDASAQTLEADEMADEDPLQDREDGDEHMTVPEMQDMAGAANQEDSAGQGAASAENVRENHSELSVPVPKENSHSSVEAPEKEGSGDAENLSNHPVNDPNASTVRNSLQLDDKQEGRQPAAKDSNQSEGRELGDVLNAWKEKLSLYQRPLVDQSRDDGATEQDVDMGDDDAGAAAESAGYEFTTTGERFDAQVLDSATKEQALEQLDSFADQESDEPHKGSDLDTQGDDPECVASAISERQENDPTLDPSSPLQPNLRRLNSSAVDHKKSEAITVMEAEKDVCADLHVQKLQEILEDMTQSKLPSVRDIQESKIYVPAADRDLNSDLPLVSESTENMALGAGAQAVDQVYEQLWIGIERKMETLATSLAENLKLILEPTLASKLKGDFKSGKRLNMKKIIPFIASDFRKDKIWKRRTQPSDREYQILVAVDNSKSMGDKKTVMLTYESLLLLVTALRKLQVGQIGVLGYGEQVSVLLPMDDTCAQQTGASFQMSSQLFSNLKFDQDKTRTELMLQESLQLLENARASHSFRSSSLGSELWQLEIVLSDGVMEDHDRVRALVRKAYEQKVMIIFVVMDRFSSSAKGAASVATSISAMQNVSVDPQSGQLVLSSYMDTFPFQYYVILQNVADLPLILCDILRQYFSLTNLR